MISSFSSLSAARDADSSGTNDFRCRVLGPNQGAQGVAAGQHVSKSANDMSHRCAEDRPDFQPIGMADCLC